MTTARPARAEVVSDAVLELGRLSVRVVVDSRQIAEAPGTNVGSVD